MDSQNRHTTLEQAVFLQQVPLQAPDQIQVRIRQIRLRIHHTHKVDDHNRTVSRTPMVSAYRLDSHIFVYILDT